MQWLCHFYFHMVVLMFLMTMKSVETQIIDVLFEMVEPGQSIVGKLGPEQPARKHLECSSMCLFDESCHGYQYKDNRTGLGQCVLIHNGCQNVQINGSAVTYKKVPSKQSEVTWTPSSNWTGPSAVLYQSFDSSEGFILMEGTQPAAMNCVPLVPGKVNNAWNLDHTKSQLVDLGIHTEACMSNMTCGAAGSAISLWVNVIDCPSDTGIVSSLQLGRAIGSTIYCYNGYIMFEVRLAIGYFHTSRSRPTEWSHVVLNYIGPNDGEGIRIYYNGAQVTSDTSKPERSHSAGDGRIVVGRRRTDIDADYASMQIDELISFNAALKSDDVQLIYNSTKC